MKLNNIKKQSNIRCLISFTDNETQEVTVTRNLKDILDLKEKLSEDDYIIVYNPSMKVKQDIIESVIEVTDGQVHFLELTTIELLQLMASKCSTLKVSNKKADLKKLNELMETPIISTLNIELGAILDVIIKNYIENVKKFAQLSDVEKEILIKQMELEENNAILSKEKKKVEKLKSEVI